MPDLGQRRPLVCCLTSPHPSPLCPSFPSLSSQVMTEVPQDEVELNLLKTELGAVNQSDVEAAELAGASIFAFNVGAVPPDVKVREEGGARQEETSLRLTLLPPTIRGTSERLY